MKNLFIALFFVVTSSLIAQDSIRISEYVHVQNTEPAEWIKRYQGDIDKYAIENMNMKDFTCDILAVGSSSINLWPDIYKDLAPMKVIKRSYGGAAIRDMIYNYDVIARGYNPKAILLYVENDLAGDKIDTSIGDTYDLFRVFINKLKRDYPTIPVFVMSVKPSPSRAKMIPDTKILNRLLKDYADNTNGVEYLDITTDMYKKDGSLKNIYREDNLHMTQEGYDLWVKAIKPTLLKTVGK